jgi:hypothetical protein
MSNINSKQLMGRIASNLMACFRPKESQNKPLFSVAVKQLYCSLVSNIHSPLITIFHKEESAHFNEIFPDEDALVDAVSDGDFYAKLFLFNSYSGRHFTELLFDAACLLSGKQQFDKLKALFAPPALQPLRAAAVVQCWPHVYKNLDHATQLLDALWTNMDNTNFNPHVRLVCDSLGFLISLSHCCGARLHDNSTVDSLFESLNQEFFSSRLPPSVLRAIVRHSDLNLLEESALLALLRSRPVNESTDAMRARDDDVFLYLGFCAIKQAMHALRLAITARESPEERDRSAKHVAAISLAFDRTREFVAGIGPLEQRLDILEDLFSLLFQTTEGEQGPVYATSELVLCHSCPLLIYTPLP